MSQFLNTSVSSIILYMTTSFDKLLFSCDQRALDSFFRPTANKSWLRESFNEYLLRCESFEKKPSPLAIREFGLDNCLQFSTSRLKSQTKKSEDLKNQADGKISDFESKNDTVKRLFSLSPPTFQKKRSNLTKREPSTQAPIADFSKNTTCETNKATLKLVSKKKRNSSIHGFIINNNDPDEFESDSELQASKPTFLTDSAVKTANERHGLLSFNLHHSTSDTDRIFNLKKILDYQESERLLQSKRTKKSYVCKYCGSMFASGCALGGHISKIHRGISLDYSKKLKIRRDQKIERDRVKFLSNIVKEES